MTDVTPPLDPEPADLAEDAPTPTHEMVAPSNRIVSGVVLTRDGVVIVQPCGWVCNTLSIVTHSALSQTSIQTHDGLRLRLSLTRQGIQKRLRNTANLPNMGWIPQYGVDSCYHSLREMLVPDVSYGILRTPRFVSGNVV